MLKPIFTFNVERPNDAAQGRAKSNKFSMLAYPAAIALCMTRAAAQLEEPPIRVVFQPSNNEALNTAIATALSASPFQKTGQLTPDVLVISIPERVKTRKDEKGTPYWEFMAKFSSNGDSLGESYETCPTTDLANCTNQLRIDAGTAMGREATRLPVQGKKD